LSLSRTATSQEDCSTPAASFSNNQFIQFNPILIIVSKEVSTDQTWAVSLQLQHKEEEALPILFLHLSTLLCTLSCGVPMEQFS